jgi:hypothetical protein
MRKIITLLVNFLLVNFGKDRAIAMNFFKIVEWKQFVVCRPKNILHIAF